MPPSPSYTEEPWIETYSEIIDVRSPSEFVEDHIPGAINLPVLDDAERAKVGTLYKQICPFTARKAGAALIAQNLSQHLSQHFADKTKAFHPLIYCWRGGQRSHSMALVLTQVGWPVTLLQGGYKSYRAYVRDQLQRLPEQLTYRVLCGLTGTGKTRVLQKLCQRQAQVLDLEALANHRGSLLGEQQQPSQPSQKYFESLVLYQLQGFDPSRPVWLEAESNKIGRVYLPRSLWQKITQASCVEIQVPIESRVEGLIKEYPHLINHPHALKTKLQRLKFRYGQAKLDQWYKLIDTQQWEFLVEDLLQNHYDPAYIRALQRTYTQIEQVFPLSDLSNETINNLVDTLVSKYSDYACSPLA
jgi:tRNA 2-selenouridine synthase